MVFCLTIGLVVVRDDHLELYLKVLDELLPEVQGESTVSIRVNGEKVSVNSEYLIQKDLGSLFSIHILGDRKQVYIATEVIKNNKNEVAFLVTW
jgi:hypothetical protein